LVGVDYGEDGERRGAGGEDAEVDSEGGGRSGGSGGLAAVTAGSGEDAGGDET